MAKKKKSKSRPKKTEEKRLFQVNGEKVMLTKKEATDQGFVWAD